MRRREFIGALGGVAVLPLAARAQQAGKIARIGLLGTPLDNPVTETGYQSFVTELRRLGFTEGVNLIVEHRRTDEGMPKAFTGANELVAAKVDVLVAVGPKSRYRLLSRRARSCPSSCWPTTTIHSHAVTSRRWRSQVVISPACFIASRNSR